MSILICHHGYNYVIIEISWKMTQSTKSSGASSLGFCCQRNFSLDLLVKPHQPASTVSIPKSKLPWIKITLFSLYMPNIYFLSNEMAELHNTKVKHCRRWASFKGRAVGAYQIVYFGTSLFVLSLFVTDMPKKRKLVWNGRNRPLTRSFQTKCWDYTIQMYSQLSNN